MMRAASGLLVTLGAFLVIGVIGTSMVSDYLETHVTILGNPGGEINMAAATLGRMRCLIDRLQVR